ncbi:MAG: GDP-L-fucose synthase [Synergistaceae bacterium]|jgi:GDP-L-fucose synthase|nr:GDP-L-fucose synthase [Synergistaceae bacterium]
MDKGAKIYVAGHNGMVGSAIMRRLSAEGYRRVVTRSRAELDLLDQRAADAFFSSEKPEVTFLAAAKVGGIMANVTNQAAFLYENLQIQNNVMRSAARHGTKKFVFLGSSCIYPRDCPQPIKESYLLTGPFEPTNEGYAVAKVAGLKLCDYFAKDGVWEGLTLVPCNLYGPGDNFDPVNSHVMAALVRRFVDAAESGCGCVTCWGTGRPRREFLHTDDLVRCMFMLLEDNPYGNEPLNVGYGSDITIRELAQIVAEKSGFQGEIAWDGTKPDGMPQKLMDSTRARKTGFAPEISIEQGVELLISEYRTIRASAGRR